jgi:hypothetical protein
MKKMLVFCEEFDNAEGIAERRRPTFWLGLTGMINRGKDSGTPVRRFGLGVEVDISSKGNCGAGVSIVSKVLLLSCVVAMASAGNKI